MRYILFPFALVFTSPNAFQNGSLFLSTERTSLSDHAFPSFREVRAVNFTIPERQKALSTTSEVLSTLADIPVHEFANKFLKLDPKRILTALKGFSIAASILAAFIESPPNNDTQKIIDNINLGFEKLESKINKQTAELKLSMGEISFYENVEKKVKGAIVGMNKFKKGQASKAECLKLFDYAGLHEVVGFIIDRAVLMQKNVIDAHRNSLRKLKEVQSLLVRYLWQTVTLEYFKLGLVHKGKKLEEQRKYLDADYEEWKTQLSSNLTKMTGELKRTFFPGYILEDVIRPVVDCVQAPRCPHTARFPSENMKIADNIAERLGKQYPWRAFAAVVLDASTAGKDYVFHSVGNRVILESAYKGKTLFVFLASEKFKEVHTRFVVDKGAETILSQQLPSHRNFDALLNYARSRKPIQMAAVMSGLNTYLSETQPNVTSTPVWIKWFQPHNFHVEVNTIVIF